MSIGRGEHKGNGILGLPYHENVDKLCHGSLNAREAELPGPRG
jgi:hypothetical protein